MIFLFILLVICTILLFYKDYKKTNKYKEKKKKEEIKMKEYKSKLKKQNIDTKSNHTLLKAGIIGASVWNQFCKDAKKRK